MSEDKNSQELRTEQSPFYFFKGLVEQAVAHQKLKTNEHLNFYIVNLLTEFSNINRFSEKFSSEEEESLIILVNRTLDLNYEEKVKKFKYIGDYSLFVSGFFADSLKRKSIDIKYYIFIGGIAYNNLAQLIRRRKEGELFGDVFGELAQKFPDFVDILAEISENTAVSSNQDILKIYEDWLRTKGKRQEELLKQKGIIPSLSVKSDFMQ